MKSRNPELKILENTPVDRIIEYLRTLKQMNMQNVHIVIDHRLHAA